MNNKKIIALILLSTVLFSSCWVPAKTVNIDDFQKTYEIKKWIISSNEKYVWILQSQNEAMLWFKLPWRVQEINVKEGDFVKSWQVLAVLWWNEVKTQFSSAKDMISSLNSMYANTKSMFDAQISSMKSKIAQSKAWMDWMKTWLWNTQNITKEQLVTAEKKVNQVKIWIETAKANLDNTKKVLSQKQETIYSNSKNAISKSQILLWNYLLFVDNLFWISEANKDKNDTFEGNLSAKDTTIKNDVKYRWRTTNQKFLDWKVESDQILEDMKNSEDVIKDEDLKKRIYDNLQKAKEILVDSRWVADKVWLALDNSATSSSFTQTTINTYKQQNTTYQNNIEWAMITAQWNYLMWVKWSIQAIDWFSRESTMQLKLLQKQVDLAVAWYETANQTYIQYKAMSNWQIDEVKTKFEVSKRQYDEAISWLQALKEQKKTQLSQISSQINQVKWNKNLAAVNLWNIKLFAPYDWVITKKMWNVWQIVWAWMPVFKIVDPKKLKWIFYMPVEDVKNVKIWQKLKIEAL